MTGRALSSIATLLALIGASIEPRAQGAPRPTELALKHATFDPTIALPAVPEAMRAADDVHLFVVQLTGPPTEARRKAIRAAGGKLCSYLPHDAYVVRMSHEAADAVRALDQTRFVGPYQPAWRLEPALVAEHLSDDAIPVRDYNIVVADKRIDKPALARAITALGGTVTDRHEGGLLLTARLDAAALLATARLDQVLWIDRWSPPEVDMDNARIQGGADYVESLLGYSGQGVRGHVYEGVEASHPDFNTPLTNVGSAGGADAHGHATAGIVFGNGSSHPSARGMAPDAVGFFTKYQSATASRHAVIGELVNTHHAMFTTSSWGSVHTTQYGSESANLDDIVFDHRIPWTQSQGNLGTRDSRPEAWAKNVLSVGGVHHGNNAITSDDSWAAGSGSIGPAADGRLKPDLAAYFEGIATSDRTGSAGYSPNNWMPNFGGTSGATPIVAGHNAIAIQMFTDGLFPSPLRVAGGSRFQNRPFGQTLKALMIANAEQYAFASNSRDNRREHVGWGFPSLRNLHDNANRMLLVAEDDVLTQGTTRSFAVTVAPGEPELKVSMTYVDPPGNPAAALARVNDLSLRVTAPNGTSYWGNNGLSNGNTSSPGGTANTVDTVENVFIAAPAPGTWTIEVIATLIAQDGHVATGNFDTTYALCAVGVDRDAARFATYGAGCARARSLPSTFYESFSAFDLGSNALRFTPHGAGGWSLTQCASCFEPTIAGGMSLANDQLSTNHPLGFAFPLPAGGSTSAIDIDSNGWIGLITGQHAGSDPTASSVEFLTDAARIAVLWDDLDPTQGGKIYFSTEPGRALVTWVEVARHGTVGSANTAQLQLYANGEFVLAYGSVSAATGMVGFSIGGGVSDPGSSDLFNPVADLPLELLVDAPPAINTQIVMSVANLPASTSAAVVSLGFSQLSIDLSILGMPRCSLLTTFDVALPATITGTSAAARLDFVNNPAIVGRTLFAQGAAIAIGENPFGVLTSNGGRLIVGR